MVNIYNYGIMDKDAFIEFSIDLLFDVNYEKLDENINYEIKGYIEEVDEDVNLLLYIDKMYKIKRTYKTTDKHKKSFPKETVKNMYRIQNNCIDPKLGRPKIIKVQKKSNPIGRTKLFTNQEDTDKRTKLGCKIRQNVKYHNTLFPDASLYKIIGRSNEDIENMVLEMDIIIKNAKINSKIKP